MSYRSVVLSPILCLAAAAAPALATEAPPPPAPPAASPAAPASPSKELRVERRVVLVDADGTAIDLDPAALSDDPQVRAEMRRLREAGGPGARPPGAGTARVMMLRRADGDGAGRKGRGGPATRLQRMADELALSPEQRKQVRGLYESARPQMDATRSQLRAERQRVRDADPADRNHAATVAAASKRIGELTAQRTQQEGELQRKVWQLLTPDQRAKAEAKRAEARQQRSQQADRLERRARELRGGTAR